MTKTESNWQGLYQADGAAAVILLVYSLLTILIMGVLGAPPATAADVFAMLQVNRFTGLLRLDVLTIFVMPFYYLLFLGFLAALKPTRPALTAIAALLGCAGLTLFLATPSVFSWLALSDKFAAATDPTQKAQLLAAGEAILASDMWHGSGAILGGILLQSGALLVALVMLGSKSFSKLTTWLGIVMFGLDLAHLLTGFFFQAGGVILMAIAGTLYLGWFPLLARDLFRLAKKSS